MGNADPRPGDEVDLAELVRAGGQLREQNRAPVVVTRGALGMLVSDPHWTSVPGVRIEGEIDPTGAGDSATAGAVLALCAGAELPEAALVGNLVASITIQQIGTTGVAHPGQLLERLQLWRSQRGQKLECVNLAVIDDSQQLIQTDAVIGGCQAEGLVRPRVARVHSAIAGIDRVGQEMHRSVHEAEVRAARMMAAESVDTGGVVQGNRHAGTDRAADTQAPRATPGRPLGRVVGIRRENGPFAQRNRVAGSVFHVGESHPARCEQQAVIPLEQMRAIPIREEPAAARVVGRGHQLTSALILPEFFHRRRGTAKDGQIQLQHRQQLRARK